MTTPLVGASHGKLNWWLRVGPTRPDGFHELETVYQELAVAEQVTISKTPGDECILTGFPKDIPSETNLMTVAWKQMKEAFPGKVGGVHFSVIKTLPQGGGIGGGSSNAAWALAAINDLYELKADIKLLRQIGAVIGSDVPFFLSGGTAVGRGRGEVIELLPTCPTYWLVLVMPGEPMSTPEAYRSLDRLRDEHSPDLFKTNTMSHFLTSLYSGDPEILAGAIHNDFDVVAQNYHWYEQCCVRLKEAGVLRTFLCGSGSTVAGLVLNEAAAVKISGLVGGIPTSTRLR